jgi:minichromosome maintenance protein 10
MTAVAKRKSNYDPAKQWGLKPEPERSSGSGEATYVVSGHVVTGGSGKHSLFVSEDMGRDAQAKAARKTSGKDADLVLQKLLKRDKEGMKVVAAAREHGKKMEERMKQSEKEPTAVNKKKGKAKATELDIEKMSDTLPNEDSADATHSKKDTYSVGLIRSIGFDPTDKNGHKSASSNVQKKVRLAYKLALTHSDKVTVARCPGLTTICS